MKSLVLVAPPRALGVLRQAFTNGLRDAIRAEIDKDLRQDAGPRDREEACRVNLTHLMSGRHEAGQTLQVFYCPALTS